MPNRIIKESALISRDLSKLSDRAERLFWRLMVVADDFGRFDAYPPVVKARCFPTMIESLKLAAVERAMAELEPRLVGYYTVDGRRYGFFVNWEKHQQRRAKTSKFPAPPEAALDPEPSAARDHERNGHDSDCNHLPAHAPVFVSGSEGEKRERTRFGFEEFWRAFPKNGGSRSKAFESWRKLAPGAGLIEKILASVERHKQTEQWRRGIIPHAATWLNQQRWEAEFDSGPVGPLTGARKEFPA